MPHMKRPVSIACVLGAVIFCYGIRSLNSQTEADWNWTNEHFGSVLDTLMPLQSRGGVYVSYRANRDYATSTPEYWFMIGHEPSGRGYGLNPYLSAHSRLAEPASIHDQLMSIHREQPEVQDTTLLQNRIKLRRSDLTEMNCPAIKDQIEKLRILPARLPDINGGTIIIHPMIHTFHISGAEGDASLALTDDKNPLVQWAEETRRALDACAKVH